MSFGSKASLKPSPKRLSDKTIREITIAGIISLHGYEFIPFNASEAREPKDGIGALTPRPKNER